MRPPGARRIVPPKLERFAALLLAVAAAAVAAAAASGQAPASPPSLAIAHVTIIDTRGGPLEPDRTVVIRDGRIASIEPGGAAVSKGTTVVDGRGRFLIPGLWDMHVHLSWTKESALPALLANGVTCVRDLGGRLPEIDEWRTRIAAGLIAGPRIFRAGPILNGKSFNPFQMVPGNPDESRGVVRALKQVGVDFIKVHRRIPRDSYFAILDEARKQNLQLVGHIPMTVTPEEASDAGQATIEHTETLFEGTFAAAMKDSDLPAAIRRFRSDAADKLFARFAANKTVVDPTLVAYHAVLVGSDPSAPPDPRDRYVAQSFKDEARKKAEPVSAEQLAAYRQTFVELCEVVRQMNRAGVTLIAGSDVAATRIPGFTLQEELTLLAGCGLTPLQALQAATWNAAKVLNATADFGAVAAGKRADLVLLDGNPLEDIRNTQRIAAVVFGGKLLRRADLDALLAEAEQRAKNN